MRILIVVASIALALMASAPFTQAQTWNQQLVDDAGDVGYDSQVVVDSNGIPFIFYKNAGFQMIVAWWVPGGGNVGGWQYASLETSVPTGYTWDVLADAQGRFHLAYARTNGARYGIWSPVTKTWVLGPETVTGGPGYSFVDMALATIGPDIIPVLAINGEGGKVSSYKRDPANGTWTSSLVDNLHNLAHGSSIALDSQQKMHVSFYENTGLNLMYATKAWSDVSWQVSTVDVTGNVGDYCSIAVTPDDRVHIVYYDGTNGDLKYAALNP
jgi:hypothetical protein